MSVIKKEPRLRFPEFSGTWEYKPLEGKVDFLSGTPIKGDEIVDENDGTTILRGVNIGEGFIRHTNDIDKFYKGDLKGLSKFLLEIDDLVIGMDGSKVGRNSSLITEKDQGSILIQRVARLRTNSTKNSIRFIYQVINSYRFHNYVDSVKTSSGIPHISSKQINSFKIGFPTIPEQKKISDFLTSVDRRIELLEKKKSLLETYKKGVMKKIFSQEIRFKDDDGNDFPEWEEKRLGDILLKKSSNISANSIEDNCGEYIIYGATGELKRIDFYEVDKPYISIVKDGSGVGRVSLCQPFSSTLGTLDILINKCNSDLKFIYYFLSTMSFLKYVTGSSIPHIYFKDYSKLKLNVPNIKEQQKISTFLSSIDNQIEILKSQIEKSKIWKKGLLQKMFV